MADEGSEGFFDRLLHYWWGHIVFALILFGLGLLTYWHISVIEARPQGGRVFWLVALVYNLVGKWGTVLLFAIPGVIFLIIGVVKFLGREDDE